MSSNSFFSRARSSPQYDNGNSNIFVVSHEGNGRTEGERQDEETRRRMERMTQEREQSFPFQNVYLNRSMKIMAIFFIILFILSLVISIFSFVGLPKVAFSKVANSKFQFIDGGKKVHMLLEIEVTVENGQNEKIELKMNSQLKLDYSIWGLEHYNPAVKIQDQILRPKEKKSVIIKWDEKIKSDSYAMQQCRVMGETRGELGIYVEKIDGYLSGSSQFPVNIKCKIE